MNSAITSREKSLLVFVLIVAVAFCGISFLIVPLTQSIEDNIASAESINKQKLDMQMVVNTIISEEEMSKAIDEAKGYYDELYNNEKMLRSNMQQINTELTAFKHNLTVVSYLPQEEVTSADLGNYSVVATEDSEKKANAVELQYYKISVDVEGTYSNILAYLDELKGLSNCLQVSMIDIRIINNSPKNIELFGDGNAAYLTLSKEMECSAKLEIRLYEIDRNIETILNSDTNPVIDEITAETGDNQ